MSERPAGRVALTMTFALLLMLLPIGATVEASSWVRLDDVEVWKDVGVFFEFRLATFKRPPEVSGDFDTVNVVLDCHSANYLPLYVRKGMQELVMNDVNWSATLADSRTFGRRLVNWACKAQYSQTEHDKWSYVDPIGAYWGRFGRHFDLRVTMVGITSDTSNIVVVNCKYRTIRVIAFVRHGGGGKDLKFEPWGPVDQNYPSMHSRKCFD